MPARVKLTDDFVEAAACPVGRKDALFFDGTLRGFALRVTAAGGRTFLLQYTVAGMRRRAVIGQWGAMTTAKARKLAETLRGEVSAQRDPVAERRKKLQAERAAEKEAAATAAAAAARGAFTVGALIDQWAALHLAERSVSYAARVPREMRGALGAWLAAPAASFDHPAAVALLDKVKVERGPVAANRLRAVARACWTWAVKRGSLPTNPWNATPQPSRETPRERVLSDAELADLWTVAGTLVEPWRSILRMLILTGQRRSEVDGMAWAELDLAASTWTIPGARAKNHRAHTVPLAAAPLDMLAEVPRIEGARLVFENLSGRAPSGYGRVKRRLDAAMKQAAARAGRPLAPWTLHDIRRTVATGLQRLGVRLEVTEAVLNHVSGSRSGIVGVYQRHGWDAEKRGALDAWSAHVLALADAKPAANGIVPAAALVERRAQKRRA